MSRQWNSHLLRRRVESGRLLVGRQIDVSTFKGAPRSGTASPEVHGGIERLERFRAEVGDRVGTVEVALVVAKDVEVALVVANETPRGCGSPPR
ncbi:hypothetical protein [Halorubrum sp. N11]|uniref:hypothetical protein n=1 Tax=Halorubrum sp. N11 TaxID=3402276 RepID=UPI003EB997A9